MNYSVAEAISCIDPHGEGSQTRPHGCHPGIRCIRQAARGGGRMIRGENEKAQDNKHYAS